MEQRSSLLNSLDLFFESMSQLYEDPQRTATAEAVLHSLSQGKRPVEDYTAEFRKWSADTGWNEPALKYQYRQGLSEALKDELARIETPATLEDLIQSATKLDRRMRERRSERSQGPRPSWMLPKPSPVHPSFPVTPVTSAPEAEPMQLGLVRAPLTPEEKQRRRQANLCLYCGGTGHFLRTCPVRPSKSRSQFFMNFQNPGLSQTYVTLSVSLQLMEKEVHLPAIIDSGACSCFLDTSLAQKLHIPLQTKEQGLQVYLADGSLPRSGFVTQQTRPILVTTDSGHQELLSFDIIFSPMFPIILGLPLATGT